MTNESEKYIVEAVNVPKTTAAGTFTTVRWSIEDADGKETIWIDIDSGVTVSSQSEDLSDPTSMVTIEVTEISRGN